MHASLRIGGAALLAAMAAACVPRAAPPAPAPAPPPPAPPPPPPPPRPPPPPVNWKDAPLSPGDWRYREGGRQAAARHFPVRGRQSRSLRCDGGGSVGLVAHGQPAPALSIHTSYGERRLPRRRSHEPDRSRLAAADPLLDQIAFSRGRFLVQAEGGPG